jgi:hypothetical protein
VTPGGPCTTVASGDPPTTGLVWPSDIGAESADVSAGPHASARAGVPHAPLTAQEWARQARACAAFGLDERSARQYSLLDRLAHHAPHAELHAQARRLLTDLAAASRHLRSARVRLHAAQRELVTTHAYARCIGVMLAALDDAACVRRRWLDSESALTLARLRAAADGAALALLNDRADALLCDERHAVFVGRPVVLPEPPVRP